MLDFEARIRIALRSLFRPLASVLMRNGVRSSLVVEELKAAFVESARAEYGSRGRPANKSKISLLTGISRRSISTILDASVSRSTESTVGNPAESLVLGTWVNLDRFVDEAGLPLDLQEDGGAGSFSDLVRCATGETDYRPFLDNLVAAGCVSITGTGRIHMERRYFPVNRDLPYLIASMVAPALYTLNGNWGLEMSTGFIQRVAHTTRIDADKVKILRRVSKERIELFVEEIDDTICSLEVGERETDASRQDRRAGPGRVGVSVCYFEIGDH